MGTESYLVQKKNPTKNVTVNATTIHANIMLTTPTVVEVEAVYKDRKLENATLELNTSKNAKT